MLQVNSYRRLINYQAKTRQANTELQTALLRTTIPIPSILLPNFHFVKGRILLNANCLIRMDIYQVGTSHIELLAIGPTISNMYFIFPIDRGGILDSFQR